MFTKDGWNVFNIRCHPTAYEREVREVQHIVPGPGRYGGPGKFKYV